ncbi:PQQ-binding-like beta-propeller repeat protein [Streptomyces sp. NPDC001744]|uniref:outer membrane protein assembly factor BamB family protein n=1 Tax=Streptomyces sp. NPDC001744 TaxID=3364606 RepID=UPI0036905391
MQDPSQPWYAPRPSPEAVPGNPYVAEGSTPPPAPARRRRPGRGPLLTSVVVLLLLAAGAGAYALRDGARSGPDVPVAAKSTGPSRTPGASRTPAARTPARIPTTREINAGRGAGDATGWIVDDRTDLPRRSIALHDPWVVGDTVVQAIHRKVVAHRLSDGAEVWSVPLPTPVCETPVAPASDGKVVVVHRSSQARNGNRCNQLRMIDLRTGRTGWQRKLTETGAGDDTIVVNTAVSGDVFAVTQSMRAAVYRVADGTKLYDIPMENPGRCHPDDVAGGTRLLVSSECAISVDRSRTYSQLREVEPRTGKVLWRYRTPPGWKIGKVLSVDPVVLTTLHAEERTDNWRVVSLGPGGKPRTTIDPRGKGFAYCAGAGESGENIQNCGGTLVGARTVVLGGADRVGAYDLGTGKLLWGVKSADTTLHPLHAEDGTRALVYETPGPDRPGGVLRLGPGGADTKQQVLRHPLSARAVELRMDAGKLVYAGGRVVITPANVSGDDADHEARMLSFAPAGP